MSISTFYNNYGKEISATAIAGTAYAAFNVASEYLLECADWTPLVTTTLLANACTALCVAAAVAGIYSALCLTSKMFSADNSVSKALAATGLGAFLYSASWMALEHFSEIAAPFCLESGESLLYSAATSFGWHVSCAAGVGAMALSAYSAYRLAKAVLA